MIVQTSRSIAGCSLLLALSVGGCSHGAHPHTADRLSGTPSFQTDSASYTLHVRSVWYETLIGVVFHNRNRGNVYFVNCGGSTGVILQKLVGTEWTDAWSPVSLFCLSPPIVVPPGGEFRTSITVVSGLPGTNYYPRFTVADVAGTYRAQFTRALVSYDARKQTFGKPLPLSDRVSNSFTIAVTPLR